MTVHSTQTTGHLYSRTLFSQMSMWCHIDTNYYHWVLCTPDLQTHKASLTEFRSETKAARIRWVEVSMTGWTCGPIRSERTHSHPTITSLALTMNGVALRVHLVPNNHQPALCSVTCGCSIMSCSLFCSSSRVSSVSISPWKRLNMNMNKGGLY